MGLEDLELLAQAAYLCGEDAASEKAWTEANQRSVETEDWARAARCAFWLGVTLQARSEMAQAGGWFARAQRVLEDNDEVPTQIIWGTNDPLGGAEVGKAVAAEIRDARLEILDAGHGPWFGHPDKVAKIVSEFSR